MKTCGTCLWYNRMDSERGRCDARLPMWFADDRQWMRGDTDATNCLHYLLLIKPLSSKEGDRSCPRCTPHPKDKP